MTDTTSIVLYLGSFVFQRLSLFVRLFVCNRHIVVKSKPNANNLSCNCEQKNPISKSPNMWFSFIHDVANPTMCQWSFNYYCFWFSRPLSHVGLKLSWTTLIVCFVSTIKWQLLPVKWFNPIRRSRIASFMSTNLVQMYFLVYLPSTSVCVGWVESRTQKYWTNNPFILNSFNKNITQRKQTACVAN